MFFILDGQFEQLTIQNKRDGPANIVLNKIGGKCPFRDLFVCENFQILPIFYFLFF